MRLASRSLLFAFVTTLLAVVGFAGPASAHNTFLSSDPADGAVLEAAPSQISMTFTKAVPIDTATVQVIDAAGSRTEVANLTHGPTGDTEVIAALPELGAGEVTVRWRLVGPDGHPLTGRVTFTIAPIAATTTVPAVVASVPPTSTSSPATTGPTTSSPSVGAASDSDAFSTPDALRWILRFGSYLAIVTLIGIVLTDQFVWPGAARRPALRRLISRSLAVAAALASLQLLVLASDISGKAPWSSIGYLDTATQTDAGMAFLMRAVLAGVVWLVLCRMEIVHDDVRWTALGVAGIALLGTWAWAGHSASQRWPELGVPVDILHHTAAALWIGALAIVGIMATRLLATEQLVPVVSRLSNVAATSVVIIVATGLVQTLRLVGGPAQLLDASHGKYLLVKLLVVAIMLALANANRRRVNARFTHPDRADDAALAGLRQSILVEFGVGLAIIGITAVMVVSPPATSTLAPGQPRGEDSSITYYSA